MKFDGPIPGQSLTSAPKAAPWERPPEIVDPEQAMAMHIERLNNEEMMENIVDMLELDIDVVTLTQGIVRGAVAAGVHSIDVGLIVSPVIHEFIVGVAEDAGIEFDEGLEDVKGKEKAKRAIEKAKAEKMLRKVLKEDRGPEAEPMPDMGQDEAAIEPEAPMEVAPKGLMARRV